jgi:pyruvate/2-oxoacid:ferredoxin oxidoreductase alpha subunit
MPCSSSSTVQETVDYMNARGEKTGMLKIRLFRPWDASAFLGALPETARDIVVLDRSREDGAVGQPLFLDVQASLYRKACCRTRRVLKRTPAPLPRRAGEPRAQRGPPEGSIA